MGGSPDPMSLLPPTPEMQPVQVRPAEAPQAGNYGLGAGFMGKAGSAAAIAAPILEGWIAGKQVKEQREQQQAQTKLAGSRNLFAMSVESYRNWQENNPNATPEEKKSKLAAVQQARDAYAGVMEQYVTPEKASTRGGRAKAGVKRALGAPTPELFAQAAVGAFKNQPLEDLVAPDALRKAQLKREEAGTKSEEAQAAAEMERTKDIQEQRQEREQNIKDTDTWSALHNKANRTPEEERQLGELTDKLGKNEEQLAKNDITRKLMGNQKLTPGEETAARAFGLIQPDQTGMLQDSTGAWFAVKVGADGKVNKTSLGVKGQLPKISTPGYYESISGLAKAYQEATPGISHQDAMAKAISAFAQAPDQDGKRITGAKFYDSMSSAMKQVWDSHKDDPAGQASIGNFIDKQGKYYFPRGMMGDSALPSQETGHLWWKSQERAGLTDDQIREREPAIRAEVAEKLMEKGFPPEQIDSIMQSWKPIASQLEAPPGTQPSKKKTFSITGPDGRTVQRQMTDDDAAALGQQNKNLKISEAGGNSRSLTPPSSGAFGLQNR